MLNCYQLSSRCPLPALAEPFPAAPRASPASPDERAKTIFKRQSAVEASAAQLRSIKLQWSFAGFGRIFSNTLKATQICRNEKK
jgi:hypothetical protein